MLAEAVGFGFESVVLDHGDPGAEWVPHAASALLDDMRQFVAEQLLAVPAIAGRARYPAETGLMVTWSGS